MAHIALPHMNQTGPAAGSATQTSTGAPAPPAPSVFPTTAWIALLAVFILAATANVLLFLRFRKKYSKLQSQRERQLAARESGRPDSAFADGGFAIASRGPVHSLEAELHSAGVRWNHVSMAFPRLAAADPESQEVILVRSEYTAIEAVRNMQVLVAQLVTNRFQPHLTEPAWIKTLGKDFDALRHPQLAISSATFYAFPFLLTWQRRHQWGVLPYATHTRLGLVVRKDHPKYSELKKLEVEYHEALAEAKREHSPYWVNDPRYVRWLPLVLEAAGDAGISFDRDSGVGVAQQHTASTLFSVGAYVHKELLPLACAVAGNSRLSLQMASYVQQLEVSEFQALLDPSGPKWPTGSALIVDLAHAPKLPDTSELQLLRLAHCVYVPVGVGFSVIAHPFLMSNRDWTNDLVRDAGRSLLPARDELSAIGIELDQRLWSKPTQR